MRRFSPRRTLATLAVGVLLSTPAAAVLAEENVFELTIRNHRFEPETLTVPANTPLKLRVENTDPTPEEFESHMLNREKIIPGGAKVIIALDPLEPGYYPFVGEFNESTAKGVIIAQ